MSNLTLANDLQTMASNKLFSHAKPLEILGLLNMPPPPFDTKDVIWWPSCFQNKTKITPRHAFLAIYILCKSDIARCNILNLRAY